MFMVYLISPSHNLIALSTPHRATLEQKAKIELAKEEAARIQHATTVPHSKPFQTAPSTKKLTGFEEFNLQSLQLHESVLQVQEQESLKSNEV